MEILLTTGSLLRVIFSYFLMFILVPNVVIGREKEDSSWLDRLFIGLVHANLFYIAASHLLVFMHLYESISLYLITALGIIIARKFYKKGEKLPRGAILAKVFDEVDDWGNWAEILKSRFLRIVRLVKSKIHSLIASVKSRPFLISGFVILIGIGLFIRFKHAFVHSYFSAADAYVHMQWSKLLSSNKIYSDGVYPFGFEFIISSLSQVFILDMYPIIRFAGPLTALLLMLAIIYWVKGHQKKEVHVALLAVAIYIAGVGLPINVWRQMSAFSMEYGAVFILPGMLFYSKYLETGSRKHLILAGEVMALILFIHPFPSVCLGVAYVIQSLIYLDKCLKPAAFIRIIAVMGSAGLAGLIFPVIALVSGKKFNTSGMDYVKDSIMPSDALEINFMTGIIQFVSNNPTASIFLLCGLIAIIVSIVRTESRWRSELAFIITAFALFAMMKGKDIGLPVLVSDDRMAVFYTLLAVIVMALPLKLLNVIPSSDRVLFWIKSAICILAIGTALYYGDFRIPVGDRFQYDETVQQLEKIKHTYHSLDWTIVSTGEELPMIFGYGYHMILWEFVQSISDPANSKPLIIPSSSIFLFVEKIPLKLKTTGIDAERNITAAQAEEPFPKLVGDPTNFYYYDLHNRSILQAKLNDWAEKYIKQHNNMTVEYEGEAIRIYKITQADPTRETNLLSP